MAIDKSPKALRTIGEVAEDVGIATHVLRFWESKFSQIRPQKRRGRRYYRQEDISLIEAIREILHNQGYTIRGVQKFLASTGKNITLASLAEKQNEAGMHEHGNNETERDPFTSDLFEYLSSPKLKEDIKPEVKQQEAQPKIKEKKLSDEAISKIEELYLGMLETKNKLKKID